MRKSSKEDSPTPSGLQSQQLALAAIQSIGDRRCRPLPDADTSLSPRVVTTSKNSETTSMPPVSLETPHAVGDHLFNSLLAQLRRDLSHEINVQIQSAVSQLRNEIVGELASKFPRDIFQSTMCTSANVENGNGAEYKNKQDGVLNSKNHMSSLEEERASPETHAMSCDADRSPGNAEHQHDQVLHSSLSRKPSSTSTINTANQSPSARAIAAAEAKLGMKNLFLDGHTTAKLPPCIYSTPLIVKWCLYGRDSSSMLEDRMVLSILMTQWLALFGHYFVTLGFLFYVHRVTVDKVRNLTPGECMSEHTLPMLRILALVAFLLSCMVEVIETRNMGVWLTRLRVEKIHQPCFAIKTLHTGERVWANGLTRNQKLLFWVVIIIPKIVITILVFFIGVRYIFLSHSNEELILNCLAMLFVMDIDDLMYQVFTPEILQGAMEELPGIRLDQRTHPRFYLADLLYGPWFRVVALVIIVAVAISLDCSIY